MSKQAIQSLYLFPAPLFYGFPRAEDAEKIHLQDEDVLIVNISGDCEKGCANYAKVLPVSSLDPIVLKALKCAYRQDRAPIESQTTMLSSLILSSVLCEEVPVARFAHELCRPDAAYSCEQPSSNIVNKNAQTRSNCHVSTSCKPVKKRTLRNRLFRSRSQILKRNASLFQRLEVFGANSSARDLIVDPEDSELAEEGEIVEEGESLSGLNVLASTSMSVVVSTMSNMPTTFSAQRKILVERDVDYLLACMQVMANRHYNDNLPRFYKHISDRDDFPEMFKALPRVNTSLSDFSNPLWLRSLLLNRVLSRNNVGEHAFVENNWVQPIAQIDWSDCDMIFASYAIALAIARLDPIRGFRCFAGPQPAFVTLAEHPLLGEAKMLAASLCGESGAHARIVLVPLQLRHLDHVRKAHWWLRSAKSDGSSVFDGGPILVDEAFRAVVDTAEMAMSLQKNLLSLKTYLTDQRSVPKAALMSSLRAPKDKADEFCRLFDPVMLPWLDALF